MQAYVVARNEAISAQVKRVWLSGDRFVPRNDGCRLKLLVFVFVLFLYSTSFAQTPYENAVFRPEIKSVEFYNTAKPASFPVISLGSDEQVVLGFDDLSGGSRTFYYTLHHCDGNWLPSNLSSAEYLQGFSEDRIPDYRYSSNTFQKYIHYEVKLPNRNIAPKLSGNYILKVYEDQDQTKMILTRRLYVVNKRVSVAANVVASSNVPARRTNQKVNFNVQYSGLLVQNPNTDLRVLVMQNARPETAVMNTVPTYVRGTQLIYTDVDINDFAGRNEFRHFDIRSLKLNSERIGRIYKDTANTVMLLGDPNRNLPDYTLLYDNDGKYYVINQDGVDARTDGDYAHIYFTLAANKPETEGTPYIVGQFNDWKINDQSKLVYDTRGRFYTNLFLKQGVYDYQYVWVNNATGKQDDILLEGTYFETENEYQLLVYYRPPGSRYEELVGYNLLVTTRP